MLSFYKEAIALHKSHRALRTGSIIPMEGDYNELAYGRFNMEEQFVVIFNNNDMERILDVRVWTAGIEDGSVLVPCLSTSGECGPVYGPEDPGSRTEGEEAGAQWPASGYKVTGGCIKIMMPAVSAIVLGHFGRG